MYSGLVTEWSAHQYRQIEKKSYRDAEAHQSRGYHLQTRHKIVELTVRFVIVTSRHQPVAFMSKVEAQIRYDRIKIYTQVLKLEVNTGLHASH